MATVQINYPADSVSLTVTGLASLASSSSLTAGYALDAISNRTNLDLSHMLSLAIKVGTTPTANTQIQIWAIPGRSFASGVVTWPACFSSSYTGTAGAFTANSAAALASAGVLVGVLNVDSTTTGRVYELQQRDLAACNGGSLWSDYAIFVTQNTGAALDSTGGNFSGSYTRVRATVA